jgi:hypothetical protein
MFRKLLTKAVMYAPDGVPDGTTPVATVPDGETPPVAVVPDGGTPVTAEPVEDTSTAGLIAATRAERVKRQEAEKEVARLREQNAYYEGMKAAAPPVVTPPTVVAPAGPPAVPNVDDFERFEDFQAADRQYIIDTARYEARQEFERGQSTQRQQETIATQTRTFQERLNKAAELDPDLPALVATFHLPGPNHVPLTEVMQDAIRESEVGPQLLRYFANNKAEATRLATLSSTSALREVGRIEATIINKPAPAVKHVSSAPEPIKPIGSGESVDVDEDKIPMADYIARERAKVLAARQRR